MRVGDALTGFAAGTSEDAYLLDTENRIFYTPARRG
jgi:hypothetical protein